MAEFVVMVSFIAVLIICVSLGISVVYALALGYLIFFGYGLYRGKSPDDVLQMSVSGFRKVKNILMIFLLIGMVTALWRAAGTIAVIINYASKLIRPSAFPVLAFLLNCLVSVLTGTSFGTAATMGVICMTMARAMGANQLFVGGAVVSGIFFGDRCSPVSSSALLVTELTGTDIYKNIRNMIRTSTVPFLLTVIVYFLLGLFSGGNGGGMDVESLFSGSFVLHWSLVLPAMLILLLSAFRIRVKITLSASILTAVICCLAVQHIPVPEIPKILLWGYRAADPEVAAMLNGGGILSMVRVAVIVGLSSSFAGIFEGTGLLAGLKHSIAGLAEKLTPFGASVAVAAVTSMISCNQTLAAILTHELCRDLEQDPEEMAMILENTVILMAPLVPWSIAGAVPVAAIGAPQACLILACYLYLVPLWNLFTHLRKKN